VNPLEKAAVLFELDENCIGVGRETVRERRGRERPPLEAITGKDIFE
jgi:hypothetical protein